MARPGSEMPTNVEGWLIAIAEHARETKEAIIAQGERQKKQEQDREPPWLNKLTKSIETAAGAAAGRGLGQVNALTQRGYAGTAEQARYDFAMQQLGLQFAAVMSPVLNGMTYAAQQFEMRMRGWNGTEQNRVMGGILGAGIGYRAAGLPGLLAGGAIGGAIGGGSSGVNSWGGIAAGAGIGAYAGYRLGGLPGAAAGTAVGGTAAAARGMGGTYDDLRATGRYTVAGAAARAGLAAAYDAGPGGFLNWGLRQAYGADSPINGRRMVGLSPTRPTEPPERRRDVTPYNPQMVGAGDTYFRFQENVVRATAGAGAVEDNSLKPIIDAIMKVFDVLVSISKGQAYTPPPTSAGDARS